MREIGKRKEKRKLPVSKTERKRGRGEKKADSRVGEVREPAARERWRAVFYFSGASVKIFSSAETVSAILPEDGREIVSCSEVVTLEALKTDAEEFRK